MKSKVSIFWFRRDLPWRTMWVCIRLLLFYQALQTAKFDKKLEYIKEWLPEFGTDAHPQPIVEDGSARDRALNIWISFAEKQSITF